MFGFLVFYLILPLLVSCYRKQQGSKICKVEVKKANVTFEEIKCLNRRCCKYGCCSWYSNTVLDVVAVLLLVTIFFIIVTVCLKCWKSRKGKEEVSEINRTQEMRPRAEIETESFLGEIPNREWRPNYGTNSLAPDWRQNLNLAEISIFTNMLFFLTSGIYLSMPLLAFCYRTRHRVCKVDLKLPPNVSLPTNKTYREVVCNHSWCCESGCCSWYINLMIVLFFVLIVFVIWAFFDKCWHKYCREMVEAQEINESRETILMTPRTQSTCSSREGLNYGTNIRAPTPLTPVDEDDRPPSYEEAMRLRS